MGELLQLLHSITLLPILNAKLKEKVYIHVYIDIGIMIIEKY